VVPQNLPTAEAFNLGMCAACIHVRRMQSDRGSVFFLCQLALTDRRFRKYPRLPVLQCDGYEESPDERSLEQRSLDQP
jgi:predicted hotdog family 3-hydroxylacyl-ACP dehydratase